jgi:YD repeat-containing protein
MGSSGKKRVSWFAPRYSTRISLIVRRAIPWCCGVLSMLAWGSAMAQAPTCPNVSVLDTVHAGVVNPSTGHVECIAIPGAELSFNGQVAPSVNLGAPTGTTTYTYDSLGRLPVETDSLGTTTFSYNGSGQIATVTDPTGNITTFAYDAQGRILTETSNSPTPNQTTTFTYDAQGRLSTEIDPQGHTTTYTYDALNRQVMVDAFGNTTTFVYDAAGNLTEEIGASGISTYSYDALHQLVSELDPGNLETTYTYDSLGELASTTDPVGRLTTYSFDAEGRLVGDIDAQGVTTFVYTVDVPEPSTLGVLAGSLIGLLRLGRKRRRVS